MEILYEEVQAGGIKFRLIEEGEERARTYLYILRNDLHDQPFGFLEDVYVEEPHRDRGYGSVLVTRVIAEAKDRGCYKLICTSRHKKTDLHEWYQRLGFTNHGLEFRINF